MFLASLEISGHPQSATQTQHRVLRLRIGARAVDFTLVLVVAYLIHTPIGPLLSLVYAAVCDCLFWPGQSVGKRWLGVQVVDQGTKEPLKSLKNWSIQFREAFVYWFADRTNRHFPAKRLAEDFWSDARPSILRNASFIVITFFAMIPIWGWLILILIGVPLTLLEVYLMTRVAEGHRLGDVMGQTQVILDSKHRSKTL